MYVCMYDLKFIVDSFRVFKASYSFPTPRKIVPVEDDPYFVVKIHSTFDASGGPLHVSAKPYFWMPSSGKESIPPHFKSILPDILRKVY